MPFVLSLLAAAASIAAGQSFACTPTRVWDGDGPIWCREGPHVRLAGIAAREIGGKCRRYQPCPKVSATASRDALARLVGTPTGKSREGHVLVRGPTMRCRSVGEAKGRQDRRLVRLAGWRRPVLRDGQGRLGTTLADVLARASVLMPFVILDSQGQLLADLDGKLIVVGSKAEAREFLTPHDQGVVSWEWWLAQNGEYGEK